MDVGAVTLDETAAREWLTQEIQQEPPGLFGVLDWSPLEIGTESQVIELIDSAQRRHVLTGQAEFVSRIGVIYTDDPNGGRYYVFTDLRLPDGGEMRLTSPARPWDKIVPEEQTGMQAALTILRVVAADSNVLLGQLRRFIEPHEQAAYQQARSDALEVTDGIEQHDECGCGEPIALWQGTWVHIYNEELRGSDDHEPEPG